MDELVMAMPRPIASLVQFHRSLNDGLLASIVFFLLSSMGDWAGAPRSSTRALSEKSDFVETPAQPFNDVE